MTTARVYPRGVRFGPWHPLAGASEAAPDAPGLLQARADQVLPYPGGRSAMVLYAGTSAHGSLRALVTALGATTLALAAATGARWIRFGETSDPAAALARLVDQFVQRFGAPPLANTGLTPPRTPE